MNIFSQLRKEYVLYAFLQLDADCADTKDYGSIDGVDEMHHRSCYNALP